MKYCSNEDDVFYQTVMTNTKTKTKTKTKFLKFPTYAMFWKRLVFEDIKYDILTGQPDGPDQFSRVSDLLLWTFLELLN